MLRFLLVVSFITFFMVPSYALQDSLVVRYDDAPLDVKKISNNDLQSYRDNPDFNYEEQVKEPSILDEIWAWVQNQIRKFFEWIFGIDAAQGPLAFFLNLLPYLLLFLLLFLLIKFFINANIRNLKNAQINKNAVGLSEEENIIRNENIDDLIQQAVANKNYRLAVRYSYLQILKLLSDNDIIAWELQKTNSDYLEEITKEHLKTPFKASTRLYEYVWYGDFLIDEPKYQKAALAFNALRKNIIENA